MQNEILSQITLSTLQKYREVFLLSLKHGLKQVKDTLTLIMKITKHSPFRISGRISCDEGKILIDSPSKHVLISEKLDADIVAKKLTFETTADFYGTIRASTLEIKSGAQVKGTAQVSEIVGESGGLTITTNSNA